MNLKKFNGSARRRGTTIAAAALSIAMVGPFVQPVVTPAAVPAAVAQDTDPNQIIEADAIAIGRVTKAANLTDAHGVGKGLISGHVYLTGPKGNPSATYDNGNVKLDGVTVYAQFRDKDGSYSPIFSAKTHTLPDVVGGNGGKGTFAFGMGDAGITWTDKLGNEHTWAARTDQKHRIWVEPYTNERGNRVEMFRQANGYVPGSFNGVAEAPLGSFVAADGNMQQMAAFMREVPPNHEKSWMAAKGDKLVEDPKGPDKTPALQGPESNMLSGHVWLETGGFPDNTFPATGPKNESKDPKADGYTVYASTLTKDGAAANKKLHEQFKDDPNKLAEETKKMLEAHPEYILKTVYGKTDKEGKYSLRFGDYTDKNQTREDFLNPQHVFVWVENPKGEVQGGYTGFHTPIFQVFNGGGNFRPLSTPGEMQTRTALVSDQGNPRYGKPNNKLYNVNHAIMPYAPVSITADYNATDKPAAPGVTVTPEFEGDLSDLPSKVEWRDHEGKVLKTCEIDQSKTAKAQVEDCTFDIPEGAKKGDLFNVVVVSGNNDVSAWSVLVSDDDSAKNEPEYEDGQAKPGEDAKVPAPKFKDNDGKDTKAPEGTKFAPSEDKEKTPKYTDKDGNEKDLPKDNVTVDPNTGEVTVKVPEDAKPDSKITVPVDVNYPDESKDTVDVTVNVEKPDTPAPVEKNKDQFQPEYEDGNGKPGDDVTVPAPEFKDKDDEETKAPEGTKFTPGDKAPEGVTVDPNTGEVTVKVPESAKPGDKITVPVDVTYPDGSKDTVEVTVTVTDPNIAVTVDAIPNMKVQRGEKVSIPVKATDGAEVTVDGLPPFLKYNPDTKAIEGVVPADAELKTWEDITVKAVLKDDEGKVVTATDSFDLTVTERMIADPDTDGDGIPDSEDTDDDNDGVNDKDEEAAGTDPKNPDSDGDGVNDGDEDTDGDGKPNKEESDADSDKVTDKDKDGIPDIIDKDNEDGPKGDKDGDGIANEDDADADGDGVNNTDEKEIGTDPLNPDTDGNGTKDGDEDFDKDGKSNADESDVPSDGRAEDKDGDGLADPDVTDKGVNGDGDEPNGIPDIRETDEGETKPKDTDGDGIPDSEDPDIDGDGVNNTDEKVAGTDPYNPTTPDKDGNKTPDGDKDTDGDGKSNKDESNPNEDKITDKDGDKIPDIIDPDNEDGPKGDKDGDGIINSEDPDADGDGVSNDDEKEAGLDPLNPDTDGNGTNDGDEDTDGDGKKNRDESEVPEGSVEDEDEDGLGDTGVTDKDPEDGKADITDGKDKSDDDNPVVPGEPGDDGKKDSDDDGLPDDKEKELGTDPNKADTDGDGINDGDEVDGSKNPFDKDGNKVKPGEKGAPTDPKKADTDGDGTNDGDEVTGDKNNGEPTDPNDPNSKPKKPMIPGLPWGPSWPVPPTKPGDDKKGKDSDNDGLTDDQEKELGTDPNKADTDGDGIKDGAEVDGSENPFDKDGNKVKPGNNGAPTDPTNPDSDGDGTNDGDEVTGSKNDGKPTDPNDADSKPGKPADADDQKPGEEPGEGGLSSNLSERCINTGLGIGLPLLFLIPVGLASQMNIPGLSDFLAPINKQIQDLNFRLQQQTNTFNGPLAKQMAGIDAQLKRFGADYHQAAGAVALIAAGALAIGLLADACAPGADEEGSSK